MKYIQLILRITLAISVLYLGAAIAAELEDIDVTAPGLAMMATALMAVNILGKAILRLIPPNRSAQLGTLPSGGLTIGPAPIPTSPAMRLLRCRGLEQRARHEAAHAVVAHALGHRIISVSITPQHASGGRVAWQHKTSLMASEDHITVAFAGPLAEQTGDVVHDTGGGADDYSALLRTAIAAAIIDPEARTPGEILDTGTRRARELVGQHTGAIDILTARLMDTEKASDLDEAEIQELLGR